MLSVREWREEADDELLSLYCSLLHTILSIALSLTATVSHTATPATATSCHRLAADCTETVAAVHSFTPRWRHHSTLTSHTSPVTVSQQFTGGTDILTPRLDSQQEEVSCIDLTGTVVVLANARFCTPHHTTLSPPLHCSSRVV